MTSATGTSTTNLIRNETRLEERNNFTLQAGFSGVCFIGYGLLSQEITSIAIGCGVIGYAALLKLSTCEIAQKIERLRQDVLTETQGAKSVASYKKKEVATQAKDQETQTSPAEDESGAAAPAGGLEAPAATDATMQTLSPGELITDLLTLAEGPTPYTHAMHETGCEWNRSTGSNIWGEIATAYNSWLSTEHEGSTPLPWDAASCPEYTITHPEKLASLIQERIS